MIILDSSAALEIACESEIGLAFETLALTDESIISPELYMIETANVLRKMARSGKVSNKDTKRIYKKCINLVDQYISDRELIPEAAIESFRLDHPTYDMLYFVLARRMDGTLFTTDIGLQNLCIEHNVDCVVLTDL